MTRNKNEAMTEMYLIPKELLKKTIKYINDAGIINLKELSAKKTWRSKKTS